MHVGLLDVPPFHVFVLDASNANMGGAKYGIRAALYTAVCARPGADVVVDSNACLHVTDDQASALKSRGSKRDSGRRGGGADYGCSSSYAFHCATACCTRTASASSCTRALLPSHRCAC